MFEKCKCCSFHGVVAADVDGNLIWDCIRTECIDDKYDNEDRMTIEEFMSGDLDKALYSDRGPYIEEEIEINF